MGGPFCGVAVEIGEAPEFADFTAFKKAVAAGAKVNAPKIAGGEAEFIGACGKRVGIRFSATPAGTAVWRDGKAHDWAEHGRHLYRATDGKPAVIGQAWLSGTLTVNTRETSFTATVGAQGGATFHNE